MSLDPRRLLHLLAVSNAGGFGRAARALGISQPALSKSIAVLERAVGVKLVERSRRGASLTIYGELLAERSRALDSVIERARGDLERSIAGLDGTLRIGASPVGCVSVVPEAVAQLANEAPDATISILELEDEQLRKLLLRGDLDIVISPDAPQPQWKGMTAEPLFSDQLVVAVGNDSPFSTRRSLTLRQIANARFAMPTPDTAMFRYIESMFVSVGISLPSHIVFSSSVLLIKSLVRNNDAITLISDRLIEPDISSDRIKAIPLRKRLGSRQICMRWPKNARPTPLVRKFIDCLTSKGRNGPTITKR